jgi:hypothetical protein
MLINKTKFLVLAFTTTMGFLLLSCSKNSNEVSAPPVAAEVSQAAGNEAANVYNSQQLWEVDRLMSVPCANNGNGEDVQLNGYVHFTDHFTVNGNHFTLTSQANYNEVSGIGLLTGDNYVANGGGRFVMQGDLVDGQFIASGSDRVNIIGPGPGNNSVAVFKGRIIVNANGTVTHEVVDISITCK